MFLNNGRFVSIAVGFSQRAGNGTTARGTLVPDKLAEALMLGLKPPECSTAFYPSAKADGNGYARNSYVFKQLLLFIHCRWLQPTDK
jgi:hypothetical protein